MLNLKKVIDNYSVIFVDLDNTLFNYTIAHNAALSAVFKEFNLNEVDYEKSKLNIKKRDLSSNHHKKELYFKNMCEEKGLSFAKSLDMYERYNDVFIDNLVADSSMLNMLTYAKENNKTVIAITNYYIIPQIKKLKKTNYLNLIDHIVTSEEFEVEKPNKKLFDYAMKLAGDPLDGEVIMFGDSTVDDFTCFNIKYHPYNCSKLLISVSGKSGAGKSKLSDMIREVCGASIIEGDGYHKYERSHKAWENITHYNPEANNLIQLSLDIKTIYHDMGKIAVPHYNHEYGVFDKTSIINNNDLDVVVIEGLHTLYPEVTGNFVKIRIFIDSDCADDQKINRDIMERQKSKDSVIKSIKTREIDYDKYIAIQKQYSNFLIEVYNNKFKITLSDELIPIGSNDPLIFEGSYCDLINTVKIIIKNMMNDRYKV